MKKFINFEIVLILVIIILAVPLYFTMIFSTYNTNTFIIDEKIMKMIAFIAVASFIIVNLIMIFYNIFKLIRNCKDKIIYKKVMKQEMNLNFNTNSELPSYGIVLASTIFFKKVRIELLKKHLQEYFRQKNILDEDNQVVEGYADKIEGLEKEFLLLFKKLDGNNKSMEGENQEFNIQKEVEEKLKKLEFIKHKSIGMFFWEFLYGKNNEYMDFDLKKNPRFIFLIICFILIFFVINTFLNIYILFTLTPFICILLVFNLNTIILSRKGKLERIKLLYLRNYLKNNEDLTDEERLFYNVLQN